MWPAIDRRTFVEHALPARLPDEVNVFRLRNQRNLQRGWRRILLARMIGVPTYFGALWLTVQRGDGQVIPYGLASLRVVTDTGVGYIVDAFQNLVEAENMKYHGFGTGGTAEAAAQTRLVTELTTQYAVDARVHRHHDRGCIGEHLSHGRNVVAGHGWHDRGHRAWDLLPGRYRWRCDARPVLVRGGEPGGRLGLADRDVRPHPSVGFVGSGRDD